MTAYRVDRSRLEALSTSEIVRILKEEKEDYTPEALAILSQILGERGVGPSLSDADAARVGFAGTVAEQLSAANVLVKSPGDAVRVLDGLLKQVLDGTVDPQVAQVASNIVMAILRAMEQAYMTDTGEDS